MEGMRNRFLPRSLRIVTWKSSNKLSGPVALWVRRRSLMSFWHCQHVPGGSTPPWSALSVYLYVPISLSGSRLRSAIEPCFYRQRHPPRCSKNTANLQRQCFASATQQHQEEWRYGGLKWLGFWKKNIQETYGNIWKPIGSSSQILGVPSKCSSINKILGLKCWILPTKPSI